MTGATSVCTRSKEWLESYFDAYMLLEVVNPMYKPYLYYNNYAHVMVLSIIKNSSVIVIDMNSIAQRR